MQEIPAQVSAATISHDGHYLAIAATDVRISVWEFK
jgi:hypothetical protein